MTGGTARRSLAAVFAALFATSVGVLILASPADAAPVNRYVATPANGGSDTSNSCTNPAHPCATIQHAVAVAANGDTVMVGAGTFTEAVTIPAPGISGAATTLTIRGAPGGTTVQGLNGPYSVFALGTGTVVTLAQLTVTNGGASGVGNSGTATLYRVTVAGNTDGLFFGFGEGGGINNGSGATLTLADSTVANNVALGEFGMGGGIYNRGTIVIADSTIADNGAGATGGGIWTVGPSSLAGTIVSGNTAADSDNCDGTVIDLGHNIDSGATCGFGADSMSNTDPALGALGLNGGPTSTMAIGGGSPALDAGRSPCSAIDQRGVPRPQPPGGRCDIGAYEYAPGVVTSLSPSTGPAAGGTSVTVSGHGFTLASQVTFGSVAASSFSVTNDSTIVAVSPPGTGIVPVRVVTPDGSGPDSAANSFTYVVRDQTSLVANPVIARVVPPKVQVFTSLSARLTDAVTSQPAAGQVITFATGGRAVCQAVTGPDGTAVCNQQRAVQAAIANRGYTATFAGSAALAPSEARGVLIEVVGLGF
jgi:hypothetical protein